MPKGYMQDVNRVEVIDNTGRAFVAYYGPGGVDIALQDDGRTLKVFVNGAKK